MNKTVTIAFAAAADGVPWKSDGDYFLTGIGSSAGSVGVSRSPSATWATLLSPVTGDESENHMGISFGNSYVPANFPVDEGSTLFVSSPAAGYAFLHLVDRQDVGS
jgi:hypothetical protein